MTKAEFEQIYHAFFTSMCLYAEKFTGDRQRAEDLAADVFAKIWEYGLKGISNIQAYLYSAVRHACIDHLKAVQRQSDTHASREYALLNFPDTEDHELIRIEVRRQMTLALEALPEAYGRVIKMAYLEQKQGKEIAEQLGISLSSVKKNKAKGLSMLRVLLGKSSLGLLLLLLR